jgi:hypothetical protein
VRIVQIRALVCEWVGGGDLSGFLNTRKQCLEILVVSEILRVDSGVVAGVG